MSALGISHSAGLQVSCGELSRSGRIGQRRLESRQVGASSAAQVTGLDALTI